MEYKIVTPLKTKHVEPWEASVMGEQKVTQKTPLTGAKIAVRGAIEFGWYEGEVPNIDEMEPTEVLGLGKAVFGAYSRAMGFDKKKSPAQ